MSTLIFLVERASIGLYILLGVGVFWYFLKWMSARHSYRATYFELERDLARYQRGTKFMVMVLLAELLLVVVGIETVVAPTIREDIAVRGEEVVQIQQESDGVFATPTRPAPSGAIPIDPSGIELGDNSVAQVFATAVLTATPVGTILPNPPPAIGCDTPGAMLQIPANNQKIDQPIEVRGTAQTENFSSYKIEIAPVGGQFGVIYSDIQPVADLATLSQFDPTPYEPGEYDLRLMVFDISNELKASCQVRIVIDLPTGTATPIGQE